VVLRRHDRLMTDVSEQAAQVLRVLALDEGLKWRIPADPVLGPLARRVARRHVAGDRLADALPRVAAGFPRRRNATAGRLLDLP
jgi:hypothetical protein